MLLFIFPLFHHGKTSHTHFFLSASRTFSGYFRTHIFFNPNDPYKNPSIVIVLSSFYIHGTKRLSCLLVPIYKHRITFLKIAVYFHRALCCLFVALLHVAGTQNFPSPMFTLKHHHARSPPSYAHRDFTTRFFSVCDVTRQNVENSLLLLCVAQQKRIML